MWLRLTVLRKICCCTARLVFGAFCLRMAWFWHSSPLGQLAGQHSMWDSLPVPTSFNREPHHTPMVSRRTRPRGCMKFGNCSQKPSDLLRHCESASQLDPPCDLGLHKQGDGSSLLRFTELCSLLKFLLKSSNFGGPSPTGSDILSRHVACDGPNESRRSQCDDQSLRCSRTLI